MKGMCVGRTVFMARGACVTIQAAKTGVIILSIVLELGYLPLKK